MGRPRVRHTMAAMVPPGLEWGGGGEDGGGGGAAAAAAGACEPVTSSSSARTARVEPHIVWNHTSSPSRLPDGCTDAILQGSQSAIDVGGNVPYTMIPDCFLAG